MQAKLAPLCQRAPLVLKDTVARQSNKKDSPAERQCDTGVADLRAWSRCFLSFSKSV